jgi:hypothetical protein
VGPGFEPQRAHHPPVASRFTVQDKPGPLPSGFPAGLAARRFVDKNRKIRQSARSSRELLCDEPLFEPLLESLSESLRQSVDNLSQLLKPRGTEHHVHHPVLRLLAERDLYPVHFVCIGL